MPKIKIQVAIMVIAALVTGSGCSKWNRSENGSAAGAGAGNVIGGVIGKAAGGSVVTGMLLASAIGGAAGAAIGHYMDREIRNVRTDLSNADVQREGEGIRAIYPADTLFTDVTDNLTATGQSQLTKFAATLKNDTGVNVIIEGYTDSTGNRQNDLAVSKKWATAVSNFLTSQGVSGDRLTAEGQGDIQPVASNATPEGRAQNRRIEIGIYARNALKEKARQGTL